MILNKNTLFILAVICILLIIPCSFASDLENTTLIGNDSVITADTTIYVANDEINGNGSQENPYNSISKAVSEFNYTKNSKIYIKNGKYNIETPIELNKNITIIGESAKGSILDANSNGEIFKINNESKITLINLTFINAKSNYGAIYIDDITDLTIESCIFENNTKSAIYHNYVWGDKLKIKITNSNFTNNKDNGALNIGHGTLLNITDSIFKDNENSNTGGAIYLYNNIKDAYITNSTFINNSAKKGSAIGLYNAGNLYVENSKFIDNYIQKITNESSVIYDTRSNNGEVILTLNKNTFTNNNADDIYTEDNVKIEYLDKNTKLTAGDVDKYYGDDYNYIVKLTDNEGNPLYGLEIIVTLTNNYNNTITTLSNITNSEGIACIYLKNQSAGKYTAITKFNGSADYTEISITNKISIRTENNYNIIFNPDYIHITEGDSYNATGYIYDEYLVPVNFVSTVFTVDWIDYVGKHLILQSGSYLVTDGNKIEFDINRCHLVTRNESYELYFSISSIGSGILTVDLSKDLSNINQNIDVIYVSKDGNDTTGDGSQNNPLATIQKALIANSVFGGGKTIIVKEGIYEISTFTIVGNVTIIGEKATLKQQNGNLGMFEIDNENTVKFINLTFTNGYATPIPESLIHITDESVAYIENCEFTNNSAYYGGVIAVSNGGNVYINNSHFHENKAILNTNGGGVIYIERGYAYISNSLFVNNTASDGGAIFLGFESEADIINSTFKNNSAIATTHTEGGGGAIFTRSNNLNIENCSFIENYAELYGGAIYIDYGALNIIKSYFENNYVKYNGENKGSAIESAYNNYCNLTIHYSILISNDTHSTSYLIYIHEIDEENHTVDLNYNYWKSMSKKSNPGFSDEVKIVISSENEYIYTGDIVEFTIDFINSNTENGTSLLDSYIHDLNLELVPTIGSITKPFITVKDNKATFIYNATSVGEETIKIGDVLLYTSYKFDIQDGFDKIDLNPIIEIIPDKTSEIIVSLNDDIQNNITIRFNNQDHSVYVNNSKANLKIDTLPGDYEVKIIYLGNETYKGFVISKTFNVARYASTINVSDITTYYNGNFQATLLSDDGKAIANETLTIKINNSEYNIRTDLNGIALLELNLQSVGSYDAIISFSGNNYYNQTQASAKITVEYANLKLTPQENVTITTIKGNYSFTLTDCENHPIKNTEVIITFNNEDYKVITDSNGIATIDLANNKLESRTYNISAKVESSDVYNSTNANSTLNVVKAKANIIADNITVYANNGNLNVILKDDDENPINNTKINIILNNKTHTLTTDENGIALLDLNLTSGNYTVTINLLENNIYQANETMTKIHVKETITKISANNITVYYNNGKFSAILLDVSGNPISNTRLIVNINGNDYMATTDENGTGSINIDNLAIGNYKVTTIFEGNNIFQASNTTSNINVISSIYSTDITRAYNSTYDFEATLKDSHGNAVVNTTITFIVNGKQYTSKTDENGVVKLKSKLAIGTYAITFTNPSTGERTSNYANIISRFSGNKNLVMDYYDGSSYKVRITDDNGKIAGAGEKVTMKINGKTYTVKTDSKGYVSLKIVNLPKSYTITSIYKGQSIKNIVTVKQILKAGKKTTTVKKSAKKLTLKAALKHSNGKAVKSKKITFKLNGKKYTGTTNSNGIAKVTINKNVIKKLKKGKYTVSLTYIKDTVKCYLIVK